MVAFENDVLRVFHLAQIIVAAQVNALSFMTGELRSRHEGPGVQRFLNAVGIDTVGGGLQSAGVGNGNIGPCSMLLSTSYTPVGPSRCMR